MSAVVLHRSLAEGRWSEMTLVEQLGQGVDHPEIVTIPETGYLKGVVLRAS